MTTSHPKSIRRRILLALHAHYGEYPLDMMEPCDLVESCALPRESLVANIHYLHDRGLIELMIGYQAASFAGARITAAGIDLVENRFEFDLTFPPAPSEGETSSAEAAMLVERLVEEGDFAPLDGEKRRCLLRDIQYVRDELARPVERWRMDVLETVLGWVEAPFENPEEILPSLVRLRAVLEQAGEA